MDETICYKKQLLIFLNITFLALTTASAKNHINILYKLYNISLNFFQLDK